MSKLIHRGNTSLKSAGCPIEFTKENIVEYLKCSNDPVYFIRTYVKIISLDEGLIPFRLYDYQENFIKAIHNNRRIISMQSRQMGKTITVAAYIVWYSIFNDDKQVAILANKAAAAREIMSRFQKTYENLPKWLQQGVRVWNKGSIELENGSKVFTAATNGSAVTGKSINMLYIDEAAVIPNTVAEDFFTSAYPTISSGKDTKVILTSTPRGYNHFWNFWNAAENRETSKSEFIPIRVDYWEHPKRDDAWAEEQKALLGEVKFSQEVLCSFVGSSFTLVSGDIISKMVPIAPLLSNDGLDVLEYAKPDHIYTLIADTSEGVGGDNSAFTVVDITELPYTVVAKYKNNKISPLLYPSVIHTAAIAYNNAFVLLEINRSEQVAYILQSELEYENILYVSRGKGGQFVSAGFGGTGKSAYGVTTDKRVKRIGCTNLKTLIEEYKILISDADIISELSTFIEHRGSYAADDGSRDDLIMTMVLFGWLTTQTFFKDLTNINLRTKLFESRMKEIDDQMVPIGCATTGPEEVKGEVFGGDYWVLVDPS